MTNLEANIFPIKLSRIELIILNNAINEILNGPSAIDEVEFSSRIGSPKLEVEELLRKIKSFIDQPNEE